MALAASLAVLAVPPAADGQGGVSIRISPPNFQFEMDPGENIAQTLTVSNPGQTPLPVVMGVSRFAPAGPGGQAQLVPDDGDPSSVTRWVTLSPRDFILDPGARQQVTVVIAVPEEAPPGGQYVAVLATIGTSAGGQDGGTLGVGQQIGSLVLLRVKGEVLETALVSGMTAPGLSNKGPVDVTVTVENTGNVHIRPVGQVTITNMFGKEVGKVELPVETVLPGSSRTFRATWDTDWGFGRYTASYVGVFGQSSKNISASAGFILFPWMIALPLLAVLSLFGYLTLRIRKRLARAMRVLASGE